jgi:hypothetical protein
MKDVYEPLERYKNYFKQEFKKNTQAVFDHLCSLASVDTEANRALCAKIYKLQEEESDSRNKGDRFLYASIGCFLIGALFLFFYFSEYRPPEWKMYSPTLPVGLTAVLVCLIIYFIYKWKDWSKRADRVREKMQVKIDEAYQQMSSLNALFGEDIPMKLIRKTVPKLEFDPFFTRGRLSELVNDFGFRDLSGELISLLSAKSGTINGNPFVIARFKYMKMGTKVYEGYRTITWTEYSYGPDGKRCPVTRSERLTATVSKPYPYYTEATFVIYGNDAAPNLKFERNPSNLLSGFMHKRRQNRKRKELKEFSQNLNDEYNYTMMGNEEFEMLFETKYRNDETEYRLLFTPLAQEQMLKLIKDETDSFGDKFVFMKDKKINYVSADQLEAISLDVGQLDFADYDFERCREKFLSINESIFKTLYFAMAPILSIPLYQQHRTQKTIYGSDDSRSSSWEWECLLNGVDEESGRRLKHVGCVTDHIVKAKKKKDVSDGMTEIEAVSCGFAGADRCDTVRVWGSDGNMHRVDVPWVEYSPVTQSSQLMVEDLKMETSEEDEFLPFRQTHACRLHF